MGFSNYLAPSLRWSQVLKMIIACQNKCLSIFCDYDEIAFLKLGVVFPYSLFRKDLASLFPFRWVGLKVVENQPEGMWYSLVESRCPCYKTVCSKTAISANQLQLLFLAPAGGMTSYHHPPLFLSSYFSIILMTWRWQMVFPWIVVTKKTLWSDW